MLQYRVKVDRAINCRFHMQNTDNNFIKVEKQTTQNKTQV